MVPSTCPLRKGVGLYEKKEIIFDSSCRVFIDPLSTFHQLRTRGFFRLEQRKEFKKCFLFSSNLRERTKL